MDEEVLSRRDPAIALWRDPSTRHDAVQMRMQLGDPAPTREDWALTRRLAKVGEIVGIGLRDHLLVAGPERWISLHRRQPW